MELRLCGSNSPNTRKSKNALHFQDKITELSSIVEKEGPVTMARTCVYRTHKRFKDNLATSTNIFHYVNMLEVSCPFR